MRGTVRAMIRIAAAGILFLLLFPGSSVALKERALTAACPSRSGERILARWGKDGMTLFLPGFWDLSAVALSMDETETLLLGEEMIPVPSGETTDLTGFACRRIVVRNEEQQERGYLTILQGSEISALFLEVDGNQLSGINHSREKTITEGRAVYTEADGSVSYDGPLDQLKGRGNNSFRYAKKPYQLKLREKVSLSGMGKGKTWVLLANWTDVSMLRNQIALDVSREIGLRNAVSCVQADVWINGIYNGLYTLTEKIQIGNGRIDITNLEKATEKVNPAPFSPGTIFTEKSAERPLIRSYPGVADPEDITGGYILTVEKKHRMRDNVLAGFRTKDELSIRIKEPTYPSEKQAAYVFNLVSETQRALMAEDGINPETGKAYDEYLDVISFAQRFLIEDWTKNYDFTGGSQFMYKDSDLADPLIYAGPSWDYDLCFGNMNDRGYSPQGKYLTAYRRNLNLYWLLYNHEPFRKQVVRIWQEVFRPAVSVLLGEADAEPDGIVRSLEEYRERISASAAMNYRRWPVSQDASGRGSGGNFDTAAAYLKKWITERTAWMDAEYIPETSADGT